MKIDLEPGKYIVAVSGGVDSATLLNVLSKLATSYESGAMSKKNHDLRLTTQNSTNFQFVVAHFDHGIRAESSSDAAFVRRLASQYDLSFELGTAELGERSSEALARHCRYKFLHETRKKHTAKAIVTAHHQDDLIETALINIIRGTKYKGIYALKSHETVIRPLRHVTKQQILGYAKTHKLEWVEDPTNHEQYYLRNKIRKQKEAHITEQSRTAIVEHLEAIERLGDQIELLASEFLQKICKSNGIDRRAFIALPHSVACEVMATYLRKNNVSFDRHVIERAVIDAKTKLPGKTSSLSGNAQIIIESKQISLQIAKVL